MSLPTIVFATNNAHKLREVRQMLAGRFTVVSLSSIGCHDDIPEEADTFAGNALAKARWVAERYGTPCFADDSGLEVDALGGEPGVHSARYAALHGGPDHDAAANNRLLVERLRLSGAPQPWRARFRTAMAMASPAGGGEPLVACGAVEGRIIEEPRGSEGFGYDPYFVADDTGGVLTFAQLPPEAKNAVSHRCRALEALLHALDAGR